MRLWTLDSPELKKKIRFLENEIALNLKISMDP